MHSTVVVVVVAVVDVVVAVDVAVVEPASGDTHHALICSEIQVTLSRAPKEETLATTDDDTTLSSLWLTLLPTATTKTLAPLPLSSCADAAITSALSCDRSLAT